MAYLLCPDLEMNNNPDYLRQFIFNNEELEFSLYIDRVTRITNSLFYHALTVSSYRRKEILLTIDRLHSSISEKLYDYNKLTTECDTQ